LKKLFSGYYRPDAKELELLWSEGMFVFDTNVLLDLYSYPETVRDVFLSVLHKVADRIWIPYQVGVEFHRNRFGRIKQSNQRVEKLLSTIQTTGKAISKEVGDIELEKRNIGICDIQDRLTAVQEAHKALSDVVQLACDKLPPISLDDKIGAEISSLLDGKVGPPPSDQADLDALIVDGPDRYDNEVPPGFADVARKGEETFRDRGITYPRKFGDLILWRQLLNHARENKVGAVVFVTGDKKKDWWWSDDGKTLGPLPDLVQEMKLGAGVDLFWMYSADQFLENAETFLKATEVTAEAVEQVKEISAKDVGLSDDFQRGALARYIASTGLTKGALDLFGGIDNDQQHHLSHRRFMRGTLEPSEEGLLGYFHGSNVEAAVEHWLRSENQGCEVLHTKSFPDLVVSSSGRLSGYQIKMVRSIIPRAFPPSVVNTLLRGYLEVNEGRLNDFSLILVLPEEGRIQLEDRNWQDDMLQRAGSLLNKYPAHSIIVGVAAEETFEPYLMISCAT